MNKQETFGYLAGFSGQMQRLTNNDSRPMEGRFDGRDVILQPGESTILPAEVAGHLHGAFTVGDKPFRLRTEDVEAVYQERGAGPDGVFRDEETGVEASSVKELLEKAKAAVVARFQRAPLTDARAPGRNPEEQPLVDELGGGAPLDSDKDGTPDPGRERPRGTIDRTANLDDPAKPGAPTVQKGK